MAGKIINTLKYGDKKTKGKLYILFGVLAAGVLGLVLAWALSNVLLGVGAFFVLVADGILLLNSSFTSKEIAGKKERIKPEKEALREKSTEKEKQEYGALEWIPGEERERKERKEKEQSVKKVVPEPEEEEITENPLVTYDEKKLKRVMVAYKVKREHVPVMIDYCQAERISQCPAYVWKDAKYLYFLLLEKEARLIKAELSDIDGIHIRRGMTARPTFEYPNMREASMLSKLFSTYLPNYYQTSQDGHRVEFKKNLYSAAPGIWCTAPSVKNILKLVPGRFILEESKIEAESSYYREIYIARVLFYDGVYSPNEYKEKVIRTLTGLAEANVSMNTFHEYLAKMMLKGLIPQEYADFAINKRAVK